MLHWLRMVIVYRQAVRARRGEPPRGAVAGMIYVLPFAIAAWALVVIGVRALL